MQWKRREKAQKVPGSAREPHWGWSNRTLQSQWDHSQAGTVSPHQPYTQHWRNRHNCILLREYEGQGAFRSTHSFLGKLGTPSEKERLTDTPLTALYLFAFYNVLGHRHFNLQVAVVLGPGIILSHSSVVAVRVCLELLLPPGGEERGDMLRSEPGKSRKPESRVQEAEREGRASAWPSCEHP